MITLIRVTDRVKLHIGDLTVEVSPLTFDQKAQIAGCYKMVSGEMVADSIKQTFLAVKFTVKSVSGIQLCNGENYQVELDKDNTLKDECVSDLLNLEVSNKLMVACANFINGVTEALRNIDGVIVEMPGESVVKK